MKVLKLLQELYLELRTFNETVESFATINEELMRSLKTPVKDHGSVELEKLNKNIDAFIDVIEKHSKFPMKRQVTRNGVSVEGITYNNVILSDYIGQIVFVEKQGENLIVRNENKEFICEAAPFPT